MCRRLLWPIDAMTLDATRSLGICEMTGLRASLRTLSAGVLALREQQKSQIRSRILAVMGERRSSVSMSRQTKSSLKGAPAGDFASGIRPIFFLLRFREQDENDCRIYCMPVDSRLGVRGEASKTQADADAHSGSNSGHGDRKSVV